VNPDKGNTSEWLIVSRRDQADHSRPDSLPDGELSGRGVGDREGPLDEPGNRVEHLERALEELKADSLGKEKALRLELDILRNEISRREQIARKEALALRNAVALSVPPTRAAAEQPRATGEGAMPSFFKLADEVAARVEKIEGRVSDANRAVRELAGPGDGVEPGEPGATTAESPDVSPIESKPDRPDINRISFEQLRELGLTVTQAARLLAARDSRGQFRSLEEIDELLDFPREIAARLKRIFRAVA
jgi:DNA uptake protein ComE-like DNA-binding protein